MKVSGLRAERIRFSEITEPRVVALVTANGGGTKLIQSFLDGHPQLYNIPAYPMLYFYPHWEAWERELRNNWDWAAIINIFCDRHASVIDSRKIRGMGGLENLGESQDEHIEIDESRFRSYLASMLEDEEIKRRTFLLAVQYAYALCRVEDISRKTVFLWHHHNIEFLDEVAADFPDLIVLAMIRDPRPKLARDFDYMSRANDVKLNETDSMIFRGRESYNANQHTIGYLPRLESLVDPDQLYLIRHEDLALQLRETMEALSRLMGIEYLDLLLESTFDGKLWWGHATYNMPPVNGTYARVLSKEWQKSNSWSDMFVVEGIYRGFVEKYGYELHYSPKVSWWHRTLLCLAILWPLRIEWQVIGFYLDPRTHLRFLRTALAEATGRTTLKDYTWSATYRYKWVYSGLNLWRPRRYKRFLAFTNGLSREGAWRWAAPPMVGLGRSLYVVVQYARFWHSFITYPTKIFKRWRLYYAVFWRRIRGRAFLPQLLR